LLMFSHTQRHERILEAVKRNLNIQSKAGLHYPNTWSIINILKYLAENTEFISEHAEEIKNAINDQLESVIEDVNTLQTARNKASKLQVKLDTTF
ncbi:6147_t:CDS:1, partial [Paraglomus occultum]